MNLGNWMRGGTLLVSSLFNSGCDGNWAQKMVSMGVEISKRAPMLGLLDDLMIKRDREISRILDSGLYTAVPTCPSDIFFSSSSAITGKSTGEAVEVILVPRIKYNENGTPFLPGITRLTASSVTIVLNGIRITNNQGIGRLYLCPSEN